MSEQLIPKQIHYCWFGRGEKPQLAVRCLESWKKYCPDYGMTEWNEDNFDVDQFAYAREAYAAGKYAFVADVARLYVLYHKGGIYMDTDVEVLRPLEAFLTDHAFSGFETDELMPTGIIGAEQGNPWVWNMLQPYAVRQFRKEDGTLDCTTNTQTITKACLAECGLKLDGRKQELKGGVVIYPRDYFCPKDSGTGKTVLTDNTYTIHHFAASWLAPEQRMKHQVAKALRSCVGESGYQRLRRLLVHRSKETGPGASQ
jgi:hypothetical protein